MYMYYNSIVHVLPVVPARSRSTCAAHTRSSWTPAARRRHSSPRASSIAWHPRSSRCTVRSILLAPRSVRRTSVLLLIPPPPYPSSLAVFYLCGVSIHTSTAHELTQTLATAPALLD
ncbi:hypothetical protein J6590_024884 [Homalodisca vitripennis]|nr:hypothetical protein J6590_024884 [Homalodisca vitripennis]